MERENQGRKTYVNFRKGNDGRFRTRDLPLAAWLHYNGVEHATMEMSGRTAWWVYGDKAGLEEIVEEYEGGVLSLDLADYLDSVSTVRGRLYKYLDSKDKLRDV